MGYSFTRFLPLFREQLEELENGNSESRKKRQVKSGSNRWTNNTVFYFIDQSISEFWGLKSAPQFKIEAESKRENISDAEKTQSIATAISMFQANTCLKFVMNSTAQNRIRVRV